MCASSKTIQRNFPFDFSNMGVSSLRISMYSSIVVLVKRIGGGELRKDLRLVTSDPTLSFLCSAKRLLYRQKRMDLFFALAQALKRFF